MELRYDPQRNVAYLRLHRETTEVETVRVSDELNVDIAPDGTVYGIELLNANEQLRAGDGGNLVVVNEAVGDRRELALGSPGDTFFGPMTMVRLARVVLPGHRRHVARRGVRSMRLLLALICGFILALSVPPCLRGQLAGA